MIAIIDYKMGNLRSVKKALDRLSIPSVVTNSHHDIARASKIILPGVGHFKRGMQELHALGMPDVLRQEVMEKKKPILGICLGMQLLTSHSEEGNVSGFDWIEAETKKFPTLASEGLSWYRVPHMGWNTVNIHNKDATLIAHLSDIPMFYFVHSYYVSCTHPQDVLSTTKYGIEFVSAVHRDNIWGTQFHPEKSHDAGLQLLKNFAELV